MYLFIYIVAMHKREVCVRLKFLEKRLHLVASSCLFVGEIVVVRQRLRWREVGMNIRLNLPKPRPLWNWQRDIQLHR